ncbi:MAG: discoidin domain-containing protein, partial [Clostridia bacterium]|nr:discoidin domain-containing protein [Clostridia bacterium]
SEIEELGNALINNENHWTVDGAEKYGWEYVLMPQVPVMTSNTAPYGEAYASKEKSANLAYFAFNEDITKQWATDNNTSLPANMGYKSINPIKLSKIRIRFGVNVSHVKFNVRVSNDKTTWKTLETIEFNQETEGVNIDKIINISSDGYYLYHDIQETELTSRTTSTAKGFIPALQFYGRALNASVPIMTSNTTPYGEVTAISTDGTTNLPWKAFDGDTTVGWTSATISSYTTNPPWLAYDFKTPILVESFSFASYKESTGFRVKNFKVQGYDKETAQWIDIYSNTSPNGATGTIYTYSFDNDKYFEKYRMLVTSTYSTSSTKSLSLRELQFYGVDYSEREFAEGSTIKYIYDNGLELEPLAISTSGETTVTKEENGIFFNRTGQNTHGTISTDSIDLSNYKNMFVSIGEKAYVTSGSYLRLHIASQTPTASEKPSVAQSSITDVPLKSRIYYLGFDIKESLILALFSYYTGTSTTVEAYIKINEWWLE